MIRFLLVSSGVVFVGSIAAFCLFVPVLSIATVVWVQVGLMLMFGLGFQAGTRGMLPAEAVGVVEPIL
jgi:hypothetical protein